MPKNIWDAVLQDSHLRIPKGGGTLYPSRFAPARYTNSHRVQRLMLSKGVKRWIWDDITRFPQYFWQMTIVRNEDISKDDASILNLLKKNF